MSTVLYRNFDCPEGIGGHVEPWQTWGNLGIYCKNCRKRIWQDTAWGWYYVETLPYHIEEEPV